jgi:hypothetical protein
VDGLCNVPRVLRTLGGGGCDEGFGTRMAREVFGKVRAYMFEKRNVEQYEMRTYESSLESRQCKNDVIHTCVP